jgi:hypothetical protein
VITSKSSATEKEKFRISSGILAVQWHFCNYLKLQKCHCTAKIPDEIRNFSFSSVLPHFKRLWFPEGNLLFSFFICKKAIVPHSVEPKQGRNYNFK